MAAIPEPELIEFEKGTTAKGKYCLWHKGYRYITRSRGNYWRCSKYKEGCRATARTVEQEEGQAVRGYLGKPHDHLPGDQYRLAEQKRAEFREQIRANPTKEQSLILAEIRAGTTFEVCTAMGSDTALKKMAYRERKKVVGNVDAPDVLAVQIPDNLLIKDGESILLYDSRLTRPNDPKVVLVFAHPQLLEVLKQNRRWSIEGKSPPSGWEQSLLISAQMNSRTVVCAQILLQGRQSNFCEEALGAIKYALSPVQPIKIQLGFDLPLIRALKTTFHQTPLTGCMFQFSQNVFTQWCCLGLKELDEDAHTTFRRVLSLALIPPQHVRRAFSLVVDGSQPGLAPFMAYFARVYVGLTDVEQAIGADAFDPRVQIVEQPQPTSSSNYHPQHSLHHGYASSSNRISPYGVPSARPSAPIMPSAGRRQNVVIRTRRWQLPLVRHPLFPVEFWNVNDQATKAIARANSAINASCSQNAGSTQKASLSDFLTTFLEDIDRQIAISRALVNERNAKKRYVIQEQLVLQTLNNAEWEEDADVMDNLTLLGRAIQCYTAGLHQNAQSGDETVDADEIAS